MIYSRGVGCRRIGNCYYVLFAVFHCDGDLVPIVKRLKAGDLPIRAEELFRNLNFLFEWNSNPLKSLSVNTLHFIYISFDAKLCEEFRKKHLASAFHAVLNSVSVTQGIIVEIYSICVCDTIYRETVCCELE